MTQEVIDAVAALEVAFAMLKTALVAPAPEAGAPAEEVAPVAETPAADAPAEGEVAA